MQKGRTQIVLPHSPKLKNAGSVPNPIRKLKFLSKITLGVSFLIFFLSYQPVFTFSFPPIKKSIVKAEATQTQEITPSSLPVQFQLPHPGYMSTTYSTFHPGIDIATGLGMPIHPIAKGRVVSTGFNFWGLGLTVEIDHGSGYKSLYAHMGKIYVKENQDVTENNTLGEVGLTGHTSGPHTHLEVYKFDKAINPKSILPEIREYPLAQDFATQSAQLSQKN